MYIVKKLSLIPCIQNIEVARTPKYELKREQEPYDALGRSEFLKPVISDGPKESTFC